MSTGKKKKILILTVILLFLIVGLVSVFVYEYFRIRPQNVRITNVTSNSVTVSWSTKSPSSATAIVNESAIPLNILGLTKEKFYDTRDVRLAQLEAVDQSSQNLYANGNLSISAEDFVTEATVENMGIYYTHHIEIKGLEPEKGYSFMIGDRLLYVNFDELSAKTLATPEEIKGPIPVYGSVKDAQNVSDTPIEELTPLNDGVVYFNYLDEFTQERSELYSGSINENGNWYLDVSGAVDSEGNHFLDRFEDTVTNISVELVVDAGPSGLWKKVLNGNFVTPSDDVVINDPLSIADEELGIVRLDSSLSNDFVKGTNAAACNFAGYCGPCYGANINDSCACPTDILDKRGCDGETTKSMDQVIQEIGGGDKCSGGVSVGSCARLNSTTWVKCEKSSNSYPKFNTAQTFENKDECEGGGLLEIVFNDDGSCTGGDTSLGNLGSVGAKCCRSGKTGTVSERIGAEDEDGNAILYCKITSRNEGGPECAVITELDIEEYGGIDDKDSFFCKTGKFTLLEQSNTNELTWKCSSGDAEVSCTTSLHEAEGEGLAEAGSPEPVCGENAREYSFSEGSWGNSSSFCKIGVRDDYFSGGNSPINFLQPGDTATWKCVSGDNSLSCSAKRLGPNPSSIVCWENRNSNLVFGEGTECGDSGDVREARLNNNNAYYCQRLAEENETSCLTGILLAKAYCYVEESGKMYECRKSKWVEVSKTNVVAVNVISLDAGETCNEENCLCNSSTLIFKNESCPEDNTPDQTPAPTPDTETTPAPVIEETPQPGSFKILDIVKKTYASSTQYILDPNLMTIEELNEGFYLFEYEGETYSFNIDQYTKGVNIYIDKNDNSEYDEGVDIKVSDIASQINIIPLSQKFEYELTEGLNFVSFPFLIEHEDYRTAASLLQKLNEVYGDVIFSIARFDGGWKMVGENTQVYDNNDFQLLPGVGYVIKARRDTKISILGQPVKYDSVEDSAPVTLYEGWNLVGIYGTGVKSYTAKSLIEDINKTEIQSDNVTTWGRDKQMYEGLQISDGQTYGFDYPINPLESYFVRVIQGSGNWQPSLRSGNN